MRPIPDRPVHRARISIHAPLAGCDMVVVSVLLSVRNFNPRTPCGVRQAPAARTLEQCHFNPRTPCGVRLNRFHCSKHPTNFNPRSPCGVRLMFDFIYLLEEQFQSTHPLRGATGKLARREFSRLISIHAPLAGCDWGDNLYESLMDGFQSTHPLRGATRFHVPLVIGH